VKPSPVTESRKVAGGHAHFSLKIRVWSSGTCRFLGADADDAIDGLVLDEPAAIEIQRDAERRAALHRERGLDQNVFSAAESFVSR